LLVVVYAEDRFLGPQCSLVSAERRLVAVFGRWAIPAHLLVCRHTGMVCSKKLPHSPAESVLQREVGRLLRGRQERRDKALLSASRRNSDPGPERKAAGPWDARDAVCLAGCHARLQQAQGIGLLRIQ
jgi:hypothetical protein